MTEAAGSTAGKCQLRVVSSSSPQPMQAMLDWYYTKAIRGGYTSEHQVDGQEHILGGTRDKDGGAYVLFLTGAAGRRHRYRHGGEQRDLIPGTRRPRGEGITKVPLIAIPR